MKTREEERIRELAAPITKELRRLSKHGGNANFDEARALLEKAKLALRRHTSLGNAEAAEFFEKAEKLLGLGKIEEEEL